MRRILIAAALPFFGGCAFAPRDEAPVRITLLHTNDHHGRFWRGADGEYGLAARKTLIDRVRAAVAAQGGHVLLLDAGDVNTGVPESDLQDAEPDFRGMSALHYDAMAVGNHEFDKGPAAIVRQRGWSSFPWLSANVYRSGARMFEPYRIFQLGPVRVAVMGLTTDDTAQMLGTGRYPGVEVRRPAVEAAALVPQLRREADVVIAATHMGHYLDGQRGVNAPGDRELAREVAGIDVIVGGHSHSAVCMTGPNARDENYRPDKECAPDRQNGAWIVQAGDWGRYVGRVDFEYRQGEFKLAHYALLPINAKGLPGQARIPEDPPLLALLTPFQEHGAAALSAPVGRTEGKFDGGRASVRAYPTNLGRLITAAMREKAGAQVAIINSGAIRDSLPEGNITRGDLLKVQPFGNRIVTVKLRGDELRTYFIAAARMTPGSGAFAQSSGVTWEGPAGASRLLVDGKPVEAAATYTLALNSFVAGGGEGYPDITQHPGYSDAGWIDADVTREYIARRGTVRAADFAP
jgi:5'-nucleotidase/UDP-sugar diphosphatase